MYTKKALITGQSCLYTGRFLSCASFCGQKAKFLPKIIPFQQILARSRRNVNLQISQVITFVVITLTTKAQLPAPETGTLQLVVPKKFQYEKNISVAADVTDITEIDTRGGA